MMDSLVEDHPMPDVECLHMTSQSAALSYTAHSLSLSAVTFSLIFLRAIMSMKK